MKPKKEELIIFNYKSTTKNKIIFKLLRPLLRPILKLFLKSMIKELEKEAKNKDINHVQKSPIIKSNTSKNKGIPYENDNQHPNMNKFHEKEIPDKDDIVNILKKVKDPETELSIFDLRLIKYIDYNEKEKKLIINASFYSRMPSCKTCQFLSFKIIDTITKELEAEFYKYPGIKNIEYIDI